MTQAFLGVINFFYKIRVVMKTDKGNCIVVMDRSKYDDKMQELLIDKNTCEKISNPPSKESNVN